MRLFVGSSDSNKALTICLLHPDNNEPKVVAEFHPKFTYPIFGDAQTIWGYQGLRVQLRFAAHDLQPNVKVWWNEKHPTVGEIAPLDIKQTLRDWLPDGEWPRIVARMVKMLTSYLQRGLWYGRGP